ncbi:MAG: restriction endonuclease subunit S, partial [Verrucomicrobia bacterium]|nr:restriction endonuclease subunit S [Verrucomicrobiota bacterium]
MIKIPADWKWKQFGEVVADSQYGVSVSATPDGATWMLRMNNIDEGKLDLSDLVRVTLASKELECSRLQKGDLLFNRTNSGDLVGKTALFEEDGEYVCASYIVRFRLRRALVDPQFVCYCFNTAHSQRIFSQLATKAVAQVNINPTALQRMLSLPVPPLEEQEVIVETLSRWDSSIEKQRALVESKLDLKRGLMQQLLTGRTRFKEFVGGRRKVETRYGAFPEEWAQVRIGDIAEEVG